MTTIEEVLYALCGGDVTKYETVKKRKVSEIAKIIILKQKEAFGHWWSINKDKR